MIWEKASAFSLLASVILAGCHASSLRERYPWGLLTDDHGILSEDDLVMNTLLAEAGPFREENNIDSYPRWQCFPTSAIIADSDDQNLARDVEGVDFPTGGIEVRLGSIRHDFFFRHGIDVSICKKWVQHVRSLMGAEKYACVGGEYSGREIDPNTGIRTYYWVYDKFKTRKGCDAWFADCDPSAVIAEQVRERENDRSQ